MLFHVFTHVNADHHLLIIKQQVGQCLGQFSFAHTCCTNKNSTCSVVSDDSSKGIIISSSKSNKLARAVQAHICPHLHSSNIAAACESSHVSQPDSTRIIIFVVINQ
eukprot:GHRR01027929.1.p1 GENE.GHRR01027929.1~~GHRR01027929.1.p1  ORF type:complete len:107 (-),score=23.29 GHRR01027929.1:474-794(-)